MTLKNDQAYFKNLVVWAPLPNIKGRFFFQLKFSRWDDFLGWKFGVEKYSQFPFPMWSKKKKNDIKRELYQQYRKSKHIWSLDL